MLPHLSIWHIKLNKEGSMNDRMQLFFMPFAGGGSTSFEDVRPLLADEFEIHVFG